MKNSMNQSRVNELKKRFKDAGYKLKINTDNLDKLNAFWWGSEYGGSDEDTPMAVITKKELLITLRVYGELLYKYIYHDEDEEIDEECESGDPFDVNYTSFGKVHNDKELNELIKNKVITMESTPWIEVQFRDKTDWLHDSYTSKADNLLDALEELLDNYLEEYAEEILTEILDELA